MPTKTKPRRGGRKPLPPGQRLVKDSVTLAIDVMSGLAAIQAVALVVMAIAKLGGVY